MACPSAQWLSAVDLVRCCCSKNDNHCMVLVTVQGECCAACKCTTQCSSDFCSSCCSCQCNGCRGDPDQCQPCEVHDTRPARLKRNYRAKVIAVMEGYSYNPPCTCAANPYNSLVVGPIATSQSSGINQVGPIATNSVPIATSRSSGINQIATNSGPIATSPSSGANQVGPITINSSGINQYYPVPIPTELDMTRLPCTPWSLVGKRDTMGAEPPPPTHDGSPARRYNTRQSPSHKLRSAQRAAKHRTQRAAKSRRPQPTQQGATEFPVKQVTFNLESDSSSPSSSSTTVVEEAP